MSKEAKLSELYYDIESGFGSANSLYDDAIKSGLVVTLHEVKEWLKSQSIKQRSNYKQYNSYSAPSARSIYSVDLMSMISLMKDTNAYNKNYPLKGFVCIDNFSKKMSCCVNAK